MNPINRHQHRIEKKGQKEFDKEFFKLINKFVFGKDVENVRKHRDIKLKTTDNRRNALALEPN